MMKILFATDGSDSSAAARQWLSAFQLPDGTAIHVVSVATSWMIPVSGPEAAALPDMATFERAQMEAAENFASEAASALKRDGMDVSSSVREGQPAYQIIRAAEAVEADLAVVGSNDLKGLEGFVLGSIARNVAHHAPCSVLIGREIKHSLRTVIVAVDGSPNSDQAIQFAASLPLPPSTRVVALMVQPLPGMFTLRRPGNAGDAGLIPADEVVKQAADRLIAAGKLATQEIREGDPATAILAFAVKREADLIVAGSRGHSFIQNLLVGSVADRLLKNASCSLLVVR